jgi:hypothetical protein
MKKISHLCLIILFTLHNYNIKSQYGISEKNVYRFCSTFLSDFCGQGTNTFSDHVIYKIYFSNWAKLIFTIYKAEVQVRMKMRKGWLKVVQT